MQRRLGKYKTMKPFKDEDRWARLTKRQWAIVIPTAMLIIGDIVLFYKLNLIFVGIIGAILLLMIGLVFLIFDEMPPDKYLLGGGMKIEKILLRLIIKKFRKKKVYSKNYDNGYGVR